MLFFKKKSLLFLSLWSLALDLCRSFYRWASLACRRLSLFLCLSLALYSKFVDMAIYLSLIRFPFSSLLTLLLSLLHQTPVAMWFPAKITSSCIWVTIPVDWVILHWYACGADGRSLARCTVTWLPNFLGWVDLLTHGVPLASALRERAPLSIFAHLTNTDLFIKQTLRAVFNTP